MCQCERGHDAYMRFTGDGAVRTSGQSNQPWLGVHSRKPLVNGRCSNFFAPLRTKPLAIYQLFRTALSSMMPILIIRPERAATFDLAYSIRRLPKPRCRYSGRTERLCSSYSPSASVAVGLRLPYKR